VPFYCQSTKDIYNNSHSIGIASKMKKFSGDDKSKIISYLTGKYNLDELKEFSYVYFPKFYEQWPEGATPKNIARELVSYCERHNLGENLWIALQSDRPTLFAEDFDSHSRVTPSIEEPDREELIPKRKEVEVGPIWIKIVGVTVIITILGLMIYRAQSFDQGGSPKGQMLGGTLTSESQTISVPTEEATSVDQLETLSTSEPTTTQELVPTSTPSVTGTFVHEQNAGEIQIVILPRGLEVERVYVPAGQFEMGNNEGEPDERPSHEVYVGSYWIDRTEVTNDQFRVFVEEIKYQTLAEVEGSGYVMKGVDLEITQATNWQYPRGPGSGILGQGDHPVVQVSWLDASTYCKWANGRLPTEAEWEYAASGPENLNYPWGNQYIDNFLNACDLSCALPWANKSYEDGHQFTSPVGTYTEGASWVGALDMAGNVTEWVNDLYEETYYGRLSTWNPLGPAAGSTRVIRGGAWMNTPINLLTTSRNQIDPTYRTDHIGFRCVSD
jgi:formylglycine-generating enzyme required for sulfatase activity